MKPSRLRRIRGGLLRAALCLLIAGQPACRISDVATRMFFRNLPAYFVPDGAEAERFETIADNLYTFRYNFDRNVVLHTDEGLVIVDSFNAEFSRRLQRHLSATFPGVPVHSLIYSHYHLDHVGGGELLQPERVLAHAKTTAYWRDLAPWQGDTVGLQPTELLRGDRTLRIGGQEIRLLYLGLSHTDTLYAFHFPAQKALFAPDMGFVKAVVPGGLPDMYFPGYLRALDRLGKLEFERFVPSHFDPGTKDDLLAFTAFMKKSRILTAAALRRHGRIESSATADTYFEDVYLPLKDEYGHWHGFDQMILPHIIRNFTGTYLGY